MQHYAVVGNPVRHSKSPLIHAAFAAQTGEKILYDTHEVDASEFESWVKAFFSVPNQCGLNVTVPFKERAFQMCDRVSPAARLSGAVNTLFLDEDGLLTGANTDGLGLVRDITRNHAFPIEGKKLLILGAGGAVRGVIPPILEEKPACIRIWNRTGEKAVQLSEHFSDVGTIVPISLDAVDEPFDLIINGTAASLSGSVPPVPRSACHEHTVLYDMMYGAEETAFLQWGRAAGVAQRIDGLGMLVEQAAEAFYIWRGVRPETKTVIGMLRA